MDPVTLAILMGVGAVGGGLQSTANDEQQRRNREELDQLLQLEEQGNLGLAGMERELYQRQLMSPVQEAATRMRTQAEQAQAAMGSTSGADLARLREEQARALGEAQQRGLALTQAADTAKADQQRQELEGRLALKTALRQDDWNTIIGGATQLAGPAGALMGAPPGTAQMSAAGGQAFGADEAAQLAAYKEANPDEFDAMLDEILAEMNAE